MAGNSMNYVKFLRGTPQDYATAEKDAGTLYFVVSPGASVGKIYLGEILVAGNLNADGTSIIDSLGELVDVKLSGLKSGQVLTYNGTEWVPMSLPDAVLGSIMVGATAGTKGTAGLVPAPQAGDEAKFLRGDGTWALVSMENTDLSEYAKKVEVEDMFDEFDDDFIKIVEKIAEIEEEQDAMENSMSWGTL